MTALLLSLFLQLTPAERAALVRDTARAEPTAKPRAERLMLFSFEGCKPCETWKNTDGERRLYMERGGWTFGDESAHIQIVDLAKQPALCAKYAPTGYPTFVLIRDGVEVKRHVGNAVDIVKVFPSMVADAPPPPREP